MDTSLMIAAQDARKEGRDMTEDEFAAAVAHGLYTGLKGVGQQLIDCVIHELVHKLDED